MICQKSFFDEYYALSAAKRNKIKNKCDSKKLFLEAYNYDAWYGNKDSSDKTKTDEKSTDLPPIPTLEGDEEVKEQKELKVLTSNKLLTKILISFTQRKSRNISYKIKNKIRQILYLLYQHNKITKNNQFIIIMEEHMIVIRDLKTI